MSSTFHNGYGGTASVSTGTPVELAIKEWSFTADVDITKFHNSKTSGFAPIDTGYSNCDDLTFILDYDFTNNPWIAVSPVTIGTVFTAVKLYLHQTGQSTLDGVYWAITGATVKSNMQSLTRDGAIVTRITCVVANGTMTPPAS